MRARVATLAELMRLKRTDGSKFVLLLGAGASLSSGIKTTATIIQELLEKHGRDIPAGETAERFDALWARTTDEQRRLFLTPYLDREPSSGYLHLARAVQEGYFDLAITLNYDDLLRKALHQVGFHDVQELVRGVVDNDETLARLAESPPRKFTILKLHGSLFSADIFLFDRGEMTVYPDAVEALVKRLTGRDIIVCGYGFADLCMMRAFSPQGGSVFWVSPSGAPSTAKGLLLKRRSRDYEISGELGMFDGFFGELNEQLFPPPKSPDPERPRTNPFKFLESFDVGDCGWFFGRGELTQQLLGMVAKRPGALHLIGPAKAGKTSLARAGVLAGLDPAAYEPIYLRCRADLVAQLREELGKRLGRDLAAVEPRAALEELAAAKGRHVVLVLDQFERVLRSLAEAEDGAARVVALMNALAAGDRERVTLLFIALYDNSYVELMWKAGLPLTPQHVQVKPFTPQEALAVVGQQADQAGLRFEPEILDALHGRFAEHTGPDGATSFTLAHLQAICYLLVRRAGSARQSYASLIGSDVESSLDSAIRECDVMNFVEDFPLRRDLLRRIMKIVPDPSRRTIAEHIRDRFAELDREAPYPEPF
jgi:hypothetical protein